MSAADSCPLLETLHLGFNQLADEALESLLSLSNLGVLDISSNRLETEKTLDTLQKMQQLKVLYMQQNPVVSLIVYVEVHIQVDVRGD